MRRLDINLLSQKTKITEQVIEHAAEKESLQTPEKKIPKAAPDKKEIKSNSVFSFNNINDSAYTGSEKYEVLKEELISVKNLYVKTLVPNPKTSEADSLAASLAEVKTPEADDFFMIEFWKTPLNSKGYKMTRSRLLIYGYLEKPDLALVKKDDLYYLRNNNMVYKLSYSAEFKPLERSTDSGADHFFSKN